MDDHLMPELQSWNSGEGISIEEWIRSTGNFDDALGYSKIFWPDFVEFEGGVFLGFQFAQEIFRECLKKSRYNLKAVEKLLNHVHVEDFFSAVRQKPTAEQLSYLAAKIRDMWAAKLRTDFPRHDIEVTVTDSAGSGPVISFSQA